MQLKRTMPSLSTLRLPTSKPIEIAQEGLCVPAFESLLTQESATGLCDALQLRLFGDPSLSELEAGQTPA